MTGGEAVAFVGTGRMGTAMVGRLRTAGARVTMYNRTRSRAEAVAESTGAEVVTTAREAAVAAPIVLVSLADDRAAYETYQGPDGIVAGIRPGTVVADTSTVHPETSQRLGALVAERGGVLLDSPVSGSVSSVERGELTMLAGGDAAALDRARPVFAAFASRVFHVGPLGAGAAMKLAVNGIVHALNLALAEALVVAERAGIPRDTAYDVIAASAVAAPFVHYKRAAFLKPETTPVAFTLDLVAKDLDLLLDLAGRLGVPVRQATTNRAAVGEAVDAGFGGRDLSVLAELIRQARG